MSMIGSDQTLEADDMGVVEKEAPVQQNNVAPEYHNLAASLDDDELKKIGAKVFEDFTQDLESRSQWELKNVEWMTLFHQNDVPKNEPWDGSSKECIPILAEAIYQFQSRTYKAFFPNRYFVDAIPVGQSSKGSRERAERVGKHMSYQLGVLDRTYKLNKSQMFMAAALHGSDFTKSYYSLTRRRIITERVRAFDLVVPYGSGPRRIDEIERKTQIKFMSQNETKILERDGWFVDEAHPWDSNSESGAKQRATDDVDGLKPSYMTNSNNEAECCILEQHCLLDLDNDGISEPYIVWVDRQSQKVLRIQIRYEVDEMGVPVDNKEPIEYFTHYQFLPNPDGFYGLGYGHLLGKMNTALNKLQRMFIDANELSVIGNLTTLVSESLGLPGDEYELSMGRANKIQRSVDDIRKHVYQFEFKPPSQETLQMIQEIQNHAEKLSSNTDILSGNPDKVYKPTALLAMVEQGLQLMSSVQEFIGNSMEEELQKIYRLNAKYLEEDQYFRWGDEQISVTREDYQDDFRIVPIFDPKYSTRSAKLSKAQAIYEFVVQNPLTMQDGESLYVASRMVLEALDAEDIDTLVKSPEIPQTVRVDDQNLENTYFLMPTEKRPLFDVFPDQDHIDHIQKIDKVIAYLDQAQPMMVPNLAGGDPQISQLLAKMGSEQKQELVGNLLRHRAQHLAYMFGQMNGVMDDQGNPVGQVGAGEMAGQPNDAGGVDALMQLLRSPSVENMPTGAIGAPQGNG